MNILIAYGTTEIIIAGDGIDQGDMASSLYFSGFSVATAFLRFYGEYFMTPCYVQ